MTATNSLLATKCTTHAECPWMQTFTGKKFYPLHPELLDVDIEDIAHMLALECRYNGATKVHFSVAQHSVMVSQAVPPANAWVGLFHDATEAFLKDIPRPLKIILADHYKPLERALARRIGDVVGADLVNLPESVEIADRRALATERRDLLVHKPDVTWDVRGLLEPYDYVIEPMTPAEAEKAFLIQAAKLMYTRGVRPT